MRVQVIGSVPDVQGHINRTRGCWLVCRTNPLYNLTQGGFYVWNFDFLIMAEYWNFNPNVLVFFPWQVVELISSAIGDVVQGLYYENCSNSEVKYQHVVVNLWWRHVQWLNVLMNKQWLNIFEFLNIKNNAQDVQQPWPTGWLFFSVSLI